MYTDLVPFTSYMIIICHKVASGLSQVLYTHIESTATITITSPLSTPKTSIAENHVQCIQIKHAQLSPDIPTACFRWYAYAILQNGL